jgi:putative nucleotidyltransferase with HDIG domain
MGLFRRRSRAPQRRPARPGNGGAGRLFLDPEAADRPVDLSGDVEASVPVPLAEEVLVRVRALEARVEGRGDRAVLAALQHTLASEGVRLPPLPRTVLRIQRLVDDPDCSAARLGAEIQRDPALATKLIGIANSPFYAGLGTCRAVPDAIIRIGMRETRNIVLAIVVKSRVFRVPGFEAHTEALSAHSLAASLSGHALAASVGADPDLGFLGGLVHDVGRAVLLLAAGAARRAHPALRPDSGVVEAAAGELHGLLGALVARSWQLGDDLADAIRAHHQPEQAPETSRPVARLLHAADALAWHVGGDASRTRAAAWTDACRVLGLASEELDGLAEEVAHAYETLRKAL